jgi:hypothetical protein
VTHIAAIRGTITPYPYDDASWQQLMTCVRDIFAPFAIEVTDTRPSSDTVYVRSVVGGLPHEIGLDDTQYGGASWYPDQCEDVDERGINFAFADEYGYSNGTITSDSVLELCAVVGQETAHNFALDHEMECKDPMSAGYQPVCVTQRTFQDVSVPCGEYSNRDCRCFGATQDSYAELLAKLGPADAVPPTVSLTSPADGETVKLGFSISYSAADDVRVDRVEIYLDGQLIMGADPTATSVKTASTLPLGPHQLEVRVVDGDENTASATASITIERACTADADCGTGLACDTNGACSGAIGSACGDYTDCASGLCYTAPDGSSTCSLECTSSSE